MDDLKLSEPRRHEGMDKMGGDGRWYLILLEYEMATRRFHRNLEDLAVRARRLGGEDVFQLLYAKAAEVAYSASRSVYGAIWEVINRLAVGPGEHEGCLATKLAAERQRADALAEEAQRTREHAKLLAGELEEARRNLEEARRTAVSAATWGLQTPTDET